MLVRVESVSDMINVGTVCTPGQVCLSRCTRWYSRVLFDSKQKKSSCIPFVHAETERQARASLGKLLVFHLRYTSQVQQNTFPILYLDPGNHRVFSPIQTITTTLAHSDQLYMQNYENFVETPIPRARTRVEDESPPTPLPHLRTGR